MLFRDIRMHIEEKLKKSFDGIGSFDVEVFYAYEPPDHEDLLAKIIGTFPDIGIEVIHRLIPVNLGGKTHYRLTWKVYY